MKMWTGFIWLRTGSSSRISSTLEWNQIIYFSYSLYW